MERDIKIDKGVLQSCVSKEQFIEIMKLQKHLAKEDDDVKIIKKAIKKLDKPTLQNLADKVKDDFGIVKLRRLLNTYDEVEWVSVDVKQDGKGRPTKLYKRMKDVN